MEMEVKFLSAAIETVDMSVKVGPPKTVDSVIFDETVDGDQFISFVEVGKQNIGNYIEIKGLETSSMKQSKDSFKPTEAYLPSVATQYILDFVTKPKTSPAKVIHKPAFRKSN